MPVPPLTARLAQVRSGERAPDTLAGVGPTDEWPVRVDRLVPVAAASWGLTGPPGAGRPLLDTPPATALRAGGATGGVLHLPKALSNAPAGGAWTRSAHTPPPRAPVTIRSRSE